jgi:hypothetical protein
MWDAGPVRDSAYRRLLPARQHLTIALRLVGAIGLSELECALSMPGGIVFSVNPRDAGSSLHVAANRLRRLQ